MSATLVLQTPVLFRSLTSGDVLAQSLVQPKLAAVGGAGDARLLLEMMLVSHFGELRADQLARYARAEVPELRTVSVVLPRSELSGKLEIKTPIELSCVVTKTVKGTAEHADEWVSIIALDATVYVRAGEDFDEVVRAEAQRIARARELSGPEYLALMPEARSWIELLSVPIGGKGPSGDTAVSGLRAEATAARRREAHEMLRSVARPFRERPTARPLLHREREEALLASLLGGTARMSVLLIGEHGVGKTGLFARWFDLESARGKAPEVYITSSAELVAGVGGFGEWQQHLERVLAAAELLDAIVYIEDLKDLLLSRREQGADVAGYLRPWLEAGRVRLVAELAKDALDEAERRQPGFLACLNRVALEPLPPKSVLEVLTAHAQHDRKHEPHRQKVAPDALAALSDLSTRYFPYGVLPGSVVLLYQELRAVDRVRTEEQRRDIDASEVYEWFSARSGVPLFLLRDDVALRRETLAAELDRQLIGQQAAKQAVIDTLCIVKARLAPRDKPLASFLFVGPTGVGKTELSRALAQVLFGDPDKLVRFDMSEYEGPHAALRLIRGDEGGAASLTRKVRENPFCVVLLDEIEKAHPSVFDLLLQLLGEARLSDDRGRTAYFHNAIVIMTSNLGATTRSVVGFDGSSTPDSAHYQKAVRDTFRPELVNRIDRIVPFTPLSREELMPVVRLLGARITSRRGMREAGLPVEVSDAAWEAFAEGGFSPAYGARGVRRHLENMLSTPLAHLCALRTRYPSADAVRVDTARVPAALCTVERGALTFSLIRRGEGKRSLSRGGAAAARGTDARRNLSRSLSLPRVRARFEEHEGLVSELAQARSQNAGYLARLATLEVREHALRGVTSVLLSAYEEVCNIEELELVALRSGEPIPRFDAELTTACARFDAALLDALVIDEPDRHAVILLVSEADERRGLDLWLLGYLANATRLDHRVRVHVDEGGTGRRWSDALDVEDARERVQDPGRTFRSVLVCVEGRGAFVALALEAGHVSYRGLVQGDASVIVEVIARGRSELSEAELTADALKPPRASTLELLRRDRCSRAFDDAEGMVTIARGRATLRCRAGEHFAALERIALAHLLLFEQDEEFDRDEALRTKLGGARS